VSLFFAGFFLTRRSIRVSEGWGRGDIGVAGYFGMRKGEGAFSNLSWDGGEGWEEVVHCICLFA